VQNNRKKTRMEKHSNIGLGKRREKIHAKGLPPRFHFNGIKRMVTREKHQVLGIAVKERQKSKDKQGSFATRTVPIKLKKWCKEKGAQQERTLRNEHGAP